MLYTGDTFYANSAFNKKVLNTQDVLSSLDDGFKVDDKKKIRFANYLINYFYSFAKPEKIVEKFGLTRKKRIPHNLQYYQIILPWLDEKIVYNQNKRILLKEEAYD